jgi:hypothetical protein
MQRVHLTLEHLKVYYDLSLRSRRGGYGSSMFGGFGFMSGGGGCDKITDRIYLGGLPQNSRFPDVGMVASINTYEEISKIAFPSEHLVLPVPDATADVANENALDAVLRIRDFLLQNPEEKILIHCKSGVGRSVMICATLLALFPDVAGLKDVSFSNAREAFEFIQARRPPAKCESDKCARADAVIELYRNLPASELEPRPDNANAYLASVTGKDNIRKLPSFINLARYAAGNDCEKAVQVLFNAILSSVDGQWLDPESPAAKTVMSASNYYAKEFFDEVHQHLANMGYDNTPKLT